MVYSTFQTQPQIHVRLSFSQLQKGFTVPLPKRYFDECSFVERCDFYTNARQICKRFLLAPGEYVLIPSTYEPDVEADFMVRVFFEKQNTIE